MIKVIVKNRKAWHEFKILDKFEAGIVLVGSEVKAIREGKMSLTDAYCHLKNRELFLVDANIAHYSHSGYTLHEQRHDRKLLLHRKELDKLKKKLDTSGLTLIPLSVYWKDNHVKVEIGLAQGKKLYDKRDDIAKRDAKRTIDQQMKRRRQE